MKYGCGRSFQNDVIILLSHKMDKPSPRDAAMAPRGEGEPEHGEPLPVGGGITPVEGPLVVGPAQREGIEPPTATPFRAAVLYH